jgi:hypothetical protein
MIGLGVDLLLDYGHQLRKPIIEPMTRVISIKLQSPLYDNNVVPLIHDMYMYNHVFIENNYDHFTEVVYTSVAA